MTPMDCQAVVIGAGPGGLGAAAELQRAGLKVLVLERADEIAATWRNAYDRLRLNTAASLSHLPGRRMPGSLGRWPARDDYVAYLDAYAAEHELEIRTGVEVRRIDRAGARWALATSSGELVADHVVVATGFSHTPVVPNWPGRARYEGRLLHSAAYRNGAPYAGQQVLVVGAGNSGAEIAVDLADAGAHVKLAIRTAPHIVTREVGPVPNQYLTVALRHAPAPLADRLIDLGSRRAFGDLRALGLPRPAAGAATRKKAKQATPVVDPGLVQALRDGRIEIVAAVESLTRGGAMLADGREVAAEAIVAATGYATGLDALVGHLGVLGDDGLPRVHGARPLQDAPGLRFLGFTDPISGNLRELRRDATRIARAIAADVTAGEDCSCTGHRARAAARCCAVPA